VVYRVFYFLKVVHGKYQHNFLIFSLKALPNFCAKLDYFRIRNPENFIPICYRKTTQNF